MSDSHKSQSLQLSFHQKYRFWLLLVAAVIIHQLPLVSIPFKWLESYFHEISHGLAALFTGGEIVQIQLFPNGAGLCTTRGGLSFVISFMGYAGATFWGMMIYSLASLHHRMAQVFSALIVLLIVCSVVFWVRDILTLVIVSCLFVLFSLHFKLKKLHHLQLILQLTGILVLLNSIFSPLYLIDGRALGDGQALANITLIPEIVWVAIWLILALGAAFILAKRQNKVSSVKLT
ncbi:MAG: M50 family metallopeptidase [Alteromonadaceae bacterium]|nr:M50 family metallopeptidase [Alteromonadaceae bacterium]